MLEILALGVLLLIAVAAATVVGPRWGIASPLLLVALGLGASLIPGVPVLTISPELVLEALLPPLLYAAAVSMPPMSMRREIVPISGLSVLLVIATALVLGLLFAWLIPDLGFACGVALGAIISPTDAAATGIVKKAGVPGRVTVILEGESLLNDATALVLLRTAIVAAVGTFSFWGALGTFVYAVVVALLIGGVAGWVTLWVRARIQDPTVATLVSFTVPFVASVPTEVLHGSGLVAAVVAGLVTAIRGARVLPPMHRLSDRTNWSSVQLVVEGAVFLTMGLQLPAVLAEVGSGSFGVGAAMGLALLAVAVTVLVRAGYVLPLLTGLQRRAGRSAKRQPMLEEMSDRVDQAAGTGESWEMPARRRPPRPDGEERPAQQRRPGRSRTASPEQIERFGRRVRRALADLDYLVRQPLGAREGVVVVWAGMRGAVTVATAQTLPLDAPNRPLLVVVAFVAATLSLMAQGLTIGPLSRRLYRDEPSVPADDERRQQDHAAVLDVLARARAEREGEEGVALIVAQRNALLDARGELSVDGDILDGALRRLDAQQVEAQLRADRTL